MENEVLYDTFDFMPFKIIEVISEEENISLCKVQYLSDS